MLVLHCDESEPLESSSRCASGGGGSWSLSVPPLDESELLESLARRVSGGGRSSSLSASLALSDEFVIESRRSGEWGMGWHRWVTSGGASSGGR